jgi:hypothetical protein
VGGRLLWVCLSVPITGHGALCRDLTRPPAQLFDESGQHRSDGRFKGRDHSRWVTHTHTHTLKNGAIRELGRERVCGEAGPIRYLDLILVFKMEAMSATTKAGANAGASLGGAGRIEVSEGHMGSRLGGSLHSVCFSTEELVGTLL